MTVSVVRGSAISAAARERARFYIAVSDSDSFGDQAAREEAMLAWRSWMAGGCRAWASPRRRARTWIVCPTASGLGIRTNDAWMSSYGFPGAASAT